MLSNFKKNSQNMVIFFSKKKEYSDTIFPFNLNFSYFGKILHHKKIATSQWVEYMPIKSLKKKIPIMFLLKIWAWRHHQLKLLQWKISYNKPMIVGGCHFQCMRSCIQNIMVHNKNWLGMGKLLSYPRCFNILGNIEPLTMFFKKSYMH
jgi:hypothetical protein